MEENKLKKNIILALILAVSMTVAMTSCGPKEEASSPETPALQSSEEQYNEVVTEAEEEVVIEPTQEILDAELTDKKVQLGTHVYQFPITLQKLLDDGAVITNDVDPDNDEMIDGLKDVEFIIDEKKYTLWFQSLNQERLQLKDCVAIDAAKYSPYSVNGIPSSYYDENLKNNIIYAKGIRIGSTVEELKNAWGEPKEDGIENIRYEIEIVEGEYLVTYVYEFCIEKKMIKTITFFKWTSGAIE